MKEFAPFRLDTVNQCLWRCHDAESEERILLTPKAFDVLQYLVDRAGRLVTQSELLDALWPDAHVQPEVLKSQILDVRNALGDRPKTPHFIETLPRRGYRFIAPVVNGMPSFPLPPALQTSDRLVGRDRPMRELSHCLAAAMQGECRVFFLAGESGIGKTSLADEFLQQVSACHPGIRTARAQCVEGFGGQEAYYPMLQALGSLCTAPDGAELVRILEAVAPTWLVQFPALLKPEHQQTLQREIMGATRERMLREICEAIASITAAIPLLLVFDDLQWVDPATVDLISALARCRQHVKLMLIATYRPADAAFSNHPLHAVRRDLLAHRLCREIDLQPLGEMEIAKYLTGEEPAAIVPEGLAGLLYRHSEGNPLFMVAALDHLTERGLIGRESTGWTLRVPLEQIELDVPESLRQMIEAQIEVLSPLQQRVLEAACIPDATIASCVSTAAADLSPEVFEEQCEALSQRNRVLRRASSHALPASDCQQYEFVHALYREVCYRRQPAGQRAKLHRRTGLRMEELFPELLHDLAPELAHHFEAGADWARAVKYLRMEAETARKRYAHREAAAILIRALELLNRLPEPERAATEIEILQRLAATYTVLSDARCIETYETLAGRAAQSGLIDAEIAALVDVALPLASISAQRYLAVLERALRLSCGQTDPVLRAKTRATCLVRRMAAAGWNSRDAEECRQSLESIRQCGNRTVIASFLIDYSFVQSMSSEYRDAYRSAAESLAILSDANEENPYLSVAHWLSHRSLLFLGCWGDALDAIRAAIARVQKNGDTYRMHTLRLYLAWVHLNAMDFTGALEICESVRPALPQIRSASGIRHCLVIMGSAEASLGRYEEAAEHLLAARDGMDREVLLFDWYWRIPLDAALTEIWLAKQSLAEAGQQAERYLRATLSMAERTWQALAWEANARVAIAGDDSAKALHCIGEALSTLENKEAPMAAWRVHATAAQIEDRRGDHLAAEHHRQCSRATIGKLADSLPAGSPLREIFLSAPLIRSIVG